MSRCALHQRCKSFDDPFPSLSMTVASNPSVAFSVVASHALPDLKHARSRLIIVLDADKVSLLSL